MKNSSYAKDLFDSGFNCAQAVFVSYARDYFKFEDDAYKLASPFGAGISYRGGMCGAVSGALMVIGLHYGYSEVSSLNDKELNYKISKEFMTIFSERNGSLACNKLLNCRIDTPEGLKLAREEDAFQACSTFVENACEILDSLFLKYPTSRQKVSVSGS
jgi:C_GCAxxG_C_C family probable redox protein